MHQEDALLILEAKLKANPERIYGIREALGISPQGCFKTTMSMLQNQPLPDAEEFVKKLCRDLGIRRRWKETVEHYLLYDEVVYQELGLKLEDYSKRNIITVEDVTNNQDMLKRWSKKKKAMEAAWGVNENRKGSERVEEFMLVWELTQLGYAPKDIVEIMDEEMSYSEVHEALRNVKSWLKGTI